MHSSLETSVLKHDFWPNENELLKTKTWIFLITMSVIKSRNDFVKFVTDWEIFEVLWSLIWQIV